ncbi:GMC oxidoreductase [Hydnum rufescens UP504]|uniref:GMC oxidoreductase n=1 Tax=Hydnum rufescens UP504 TaxID=1448309 RepID=A0A9P6BCH9_9AGAM|nr:GMC oxidoreductase [Hydnum rufescens UP504]
MDLVNSHMPMAWQKFHFTEHDWNYDSEPQKHANNRVIHLPRGKFLSGCSGLNGTIITRGCKADYDEWEALGNPGWSWNDVLPLFKKSERFIPTEGFGAATEYHGTNGELVTTVHPQAPISDAILDSYINKGISYRPDMFVQGEGEGVGHVTRTVHDGVRTSGADFVNKNPPANLYVLLETTVLRVVLESLPDSESTDSSKYRAVAVEAESTSKQMKEIIISAGAYNSPCILMHSGIGPKDHLEECGIDVKVDLKSVGQNLSDHPSVFQFYLLKSKMTYDHLIYPPGAMDSTLKEWLESKSGILGRFPFGPFVFLRLDKLMEDKPEWKAAKEKNPEKDPMGQLPGQPHVEYFSTELYGGGPQHSDLPIKGESCFAVITMLCGTQSRGSIRLNASDPHVKPKIDHNYLANELDVAVLAEGCRYVNEIVTEGAGTREHIAGPWPTTRAHPNGDKQWKEYVRQQAGTCYHPASTCKMGPDEDEEAVVDPRLRVRGVKSLRVADISIMPKLNNGHPQAPAYMIGEKAAQLILEDNRIIG